MNAGENTEKKLALKERNIALGMTSIFIIIFVACYCFFTFHNATNNIEKSTGEVFILKDEVVETGYIYLEKNSNRQ